MQRKISWLAGVMLVLLQMAASPQHTSAATAMIFCNGNMADPATLTTAKINGYRASGMNTMVIFTMTVQANGDFTYGPYTLCSGGNYTGPANFGSLLNQCLAAPSSVNRIEMCIGEWGSASFANIKNIIAAQGNNTGNILWRNLVALRNALPITAIDFDDETTYDSGSAVIFGGMAGSMGYKVTLCPYTNPGYWQAVKNGLGGYCDAIYLQCYDGGAGNNPATWNTYFGGMKVIPGYWDYERDTTFLTKMQAWKSAGNLGGFLWPSCSGCNPPADGNEMLQYANWIHQTMDVCVSGATYGLRARHSGKFLDAYFALTTNGTKLAQSSWNGGNNLKWVANSMGGNQYTFTGVQSGRNVDVNGASTAVIQLQLWDVNNSVAQKWAANPTDSGYYQFMNVNSGKVMDVNGASTADGAGVFQDTWNGGNNQQWALVQLQPGYTYCAIENGSTTFGQTVDVAYGAYGHFNYKNGVTGTITFNPSTFGGDPAFGVVKSGYYKVSTGGGPAGYAYCVPENGSFTFNTVNQKVDVAFGANGSFRYLTNVTGTINFNNTTFAPDPAPGVVKAGYFRVY